MRNETTEIAAGGRDRHRYFEHSSGRPLASWGRAGATPPRALRHLISAAAPASSSFFLIVSASAFDTPSLTVDGTPSTEVLGFLQAEAGDLADDLDDADLVGAEAGHRDGELGLLFDRAAAAAAAAGAATATGARRVTPNFSSIILHELDDFHDGHVGDRVRGCLPS